MVCLYQIAEGAASKFSIASGGSSWLHPTGREGPERIIRPGVLGVASSEGLPDFRIAGRPEAGEILQLAEVDAALDTAIPGSPTANSVNERLKTLDDNYTSTRAAFLDKLNVTGNVASSAEVTSRTSRMCASAAASSPVAG